MSTKPKNKLLMVDDDNITLKLVKGVLNDVFHVDTATNFNDALELLDHNDYSLLLLDYNMPDINGLELASILKEKFKKTKIQIPFMFITSNTSNDTINKAFAIGASDYIKKPINVVELKARIKSIVERYENHNLLHKQTQEFDEYKKVLNDSDIVSKANIHGIITYVNDKFCEISGYSRDELLGKNHSILKHPDSPDSLFQDLWKTITSKKTFNSIIKNRKKNGDSYYVDATISPILDLNGEISEYLAIRHDVTSMMNPKKQMLDFISHLNKSIVVLVQITNYEMIREFYSEDIRTRFELSFEKTLFECLPSHTTVEKIFNLGGGLFGFVKSSSKDATSVNLFLQEVLKKLRIKGVDFEDNKYEIDVVFSFSLKGQHLYEDALIGIYQGLETKESIVYADRFYLDKQEKAREKLKTLSDIRQALKQPDKVVSYYQPIVDNKTKNIVKYESLIRMINHKNEVLSPYYFLDIAKKTGYYHDITLRVIENANNILDISNINININLSLSDLKDVQIRTELLNLISKAKNKGRITFELLEDEEIKDFSLVKDFIGLSKLIGDVTIAIDDFGSGYSNYERLLDFQPDYIKIDGSLIKNIKDPYSHSVIKSIVLFAKENNLKTVAEFVGDEETYIAVNELDIDFSQGYYFGKPEPYSQQK